MDGEEITCHRSEKLNRRESVFSTLAWIPCHGGPDVETTKANGVGEEFVFYPLELQFDTNSGAVFGSKILGQKF